MNHLAVALALIFAPPILALMARKFSPTWAKMRLTSLIVALWLLAILPVCNVVTVAIGGAVVTSAASPKRGGLTLPPTIPYAQEIERAAARHGLDPALLAALVDVESSFNPRAVSYAGAMGLAQVMPVTAGELGLSDPYDPAANLDAGARYLAWLLGRYGRLDLALAAYNAGPGRVDRCGRCIPGNHGYVSDVSRLWDYYTILSLIPDGARITDNNRNPKPFKGVDYVTGCQSPIFSPVSGLVTGKGYDGFVGRHGDNNSFLILETADFELILLHGRYNVAIGQAVQRGDLLGHEASVGNSTGCHTDISIRRR